MVTTTPRSYLILALLVVCQCWISSVFTDVLFTVPTSPESTSSITVSFSELLFGRFHECLCNGTSSKCVAEYDNNLAALRISRDPGFFQYDDFSESKIYACRNAVSNSIDRPALECIRIPGENCASDLNVRFFRLDGVQACHSQCIGILLQRGESMESHNVTFVKSCNDGCADSNPTTLLPSDILDSTGSTFNLASSYGIDTSFTNVPMTIYPSTPFFTPQLVSINITNMLKLSSSIGNVSSVALPQIMLSTTEMYTIISDSTTDRSTTFPSEIISISTEPHTDKTNTIKIHSSPAFSNAIPLSSTTMPFNPSYANDHMAAESNSFSSSSQQTWPTWEGTMTVTEANVFLTPEFITDLSSAVPHPTTTSLTPSNIGTSLSNTEAIFTLTRLTTADSDLISKLAMPSVSISINSSIYETLTQAATAVVSDSLSHTTQNYVSGSDYNKTENTKILSKTMSYQTLATTTSSYTATFLLSSTGNLLDSTRINLFTTQPLHTASPSEFASNFLSTKMTPSATVAVPALNPSSTYHTTIGIASSENKSSFRVDMLHVIMGVTLGIFSVVMIVLIVVLAVKLHKEEVERRQTALLEHTQSVHSDNESPIDISPQPELSLPSTSSMDLIEENKDVYAFVNKAYKPGPDRIKSNISSAELLDQQRNEQSYEEHPRMSYSPLSGHYSFMIDTEDNAEDDADSFSDESSLASEEYQMPLDESRSSLKQVSFQNPISEEIMLNMNDEDSESDSFDSIVNFPFASMENFDMNDDDEDGDNDDNDGHVGGDDEEEEDYPVDHFHFEAPDNESLDHMPCECGDRSGTDPLAFTQGRTGIDDIVDDNDDD